MNINPSDGHNFGWGTVNGAEGWPVDGKAVGSTGNALRKDFTDSSVWASKATHIAVVRHNDGKCDEVKAWKFKEGGKHSMYNYFADDAANHPHQRATVTTGGAVFSQKRAGTTDRPSDAIVGPDGDLVFNWHHANNGARIASTGSHLSAVGVNDDDTHGFGNEFGAETNTATGTATHHKATATDDGGKSVSKGSTSWWHDIAIKQGDCHGGSCVMQGSDHGSELKDGVMFGQYGIYIANIANQGDVSFPCSGAALTQSQRTHNAKPVQSGTYICICMYILVPT